MNREDKLQELKKELESREAGLQMLYFSDMYDSEAIRYCESKIADIKAQIEELGKADE